MIYGTAWKEDRTEGLVLEALRAGFRAIDTANQRKHYFEEAVGKGLQAFLASAPSVKREDLFLQTKYTYARGQDHRKPYDERAPYPEQVRSSFESSLGHLGTSYVDSYLLHGPYGNEGIAEPDLAVWREMERLHAEGRARKLGVSNVDRGQLEELFRIASVKPSFVQNRCFAATGWDADVRAFCRGNGIVYQGFSLLTANPGILRDPFVRDLASRHGKTVPQIVFRFCAQIGILPLTGTSSPVHMREDLEAAGFDLTEEELLALADL